MISRFAGDSPELNVLISHFIEPFWRSPKRLMSHVGECPVLETRSTSNLGRPGS